MAIPKRIREQTGRYAMVDGIPFELPVDCVDSEAFFTAFPIDAEKAQKLLPDGIQAFKIAGKGLLVITVINYKKTDIGKYIEFSIGIACTQGRKPVSGLLASIFQSHYGTGQFVYDLPVSTEVSVKGGKGIWGMPKRRASLDFRIEDHTISSQYDLDGEFMMRIEMRRPGRVWLPFSTAAVNYASFRGMLWKSYLYFSGRSGVSLFQRGAATLMLGDHPRMRALAALDIGPDPWIAAFIPKANGVLDDHAESWFLTYAEPQRIAPEGLETVASLSRSEVWPPAPNQRQRIAAPVLESTTSQGASMATVEFTEEMKGYVTFGETDFDRGYRAGREQNNYLMFHLTIKADDVDKFVADPRHVADAVGYVECAQLGGKLPVEKGVFNLFVEVDAKTKRMLYRLWFRDSSGAPLTLTGFKVIADDPGVDIWTDTTTLFTRVLSGHVNAEDDASANIVASGIIVIQMLDFMKQLTTFRFTAPDTATQMAAAKAFGTLFMGGLWDTYGSKLMPGHEKARGAAQG